MILSNDHSFFVYRYNTYHHTQVHRGSGVHYLAMLTRGNARIETKNQTLHIRQGEIFYIPKRLQYDSYWYGQPEIEFLSFGFANMPVRDQNSYVLQIVPHSEALETMLRAIPLQGNLVGSRALSLFYAALAEATAQMSHKPGALANELTDGAMYYIRKHPHAQISEVARACNVSEAYLYTKFRSVVGESPNTYRQRMLCSRAVELLTTTDMPVQEISEQLQFSSPSYFRKVFRQITGKTPRQCREQSVNSLSP